LSEQDFSVFVMTVSLVFRVTYSLGHGGSANYLLKETIEFIYLPTKSVGSLSSASTWVRPEFLYITASDYSTVLVLRDWIIHTKGTTLGLQMHTYYPLRQKLESVII